MIHGFVSSKQLIPVVGIELHQLSGPCRVQSVVQSLTENNVNATNNVPDELAAKESVA